MALKSTSSSFDNPDPWNDDLHVIRFLSFQKQLFGFNFHLSSQLYQKDWLLFSSKDLKVLMFKVCRCTGSMGERDFYWAKINI